MNLRLMCEIAIGIVAYVLYFIYDYNSITKKNKFLSSFFLLGTVLIAVSTALVIMDYFFVSALGLVFIIAALGFLGLLIYTLAFALPFEETYVKENAPRKTYTGGVYSICRHPGVLWLIGMYLCFMGLSANIGATCFYAVIIAGDIAYIIYQDIYIFPRTFTDYDEYKKTTPFLIPVIGKLFLKKK